jgi:adenylosuccinate lyase
MLHAISPVDGRYASKTKALSPYFSEFGLIKKRVLVEVEYYIALCASGIPQLQEIDTEGKAALRNIYKHFSDEDAIEIKEIEAVTNHDVKAVEYFVKEKMEQLGIGDKKEWVHFALTSQDINNTAVPLLLKDAIDEVVIIELGSIHNAISAMAGQWQSVPMLAHTHGQPATPTTVGKEIRVFAERLEYQLNTLTHLAHYGKFGGATGNFNAHLIAFSDINWQEFGDTFLEDLGIKRIQTTTQIDHYDHVAELLHCMMRISTILIDLCRDIWSYISMEYFTQKTIAGEVGSSTMPHKVNPIDFENAEGNLGMAIAVFEHLAGKLPISRQQRDLTDSTVLRNIGVPFAHVIIAVKSLSKGLSKLELNEEKLHADLEKNWMVVAEAIQTILRREGVAQPYELLKGLTRGKERVTQEVMNAFIDSLDVSEVVKFELKSITPFNYLGYAK